MGDNRQSSQQLLCLLTQPFCLAVWYFSLYQSGKNTHIHILRRTGGGGWWETDGYFRAVIDANGCLYSVVEQILTSFTLTNITTRRNGVLNGNTLEMLLG